VGHSPPEYAGFCHTHPADATGRPVFGFSALDYRASLADGDNLALVCNGPHVFALVRTDMTEPRRVAPAAEIGRWRRIYDDQFRRARERMEADPGAHHALDKALLEANRLLCLELRFALY